MFQDRGHCPSDEAALSSIYLALRTITKSWEKTHR